MIPSSIFQEPPENVDETWTHGAMIGGMCGYSDHDLAGSYLRLVSEKCQSP